MATIKKKASLQEENIIDLVAEVRKKVIKKKSDQEINILERNIETFKRLNKRVSSRIYYIKKKIDNANPEDMKLLDYYQELKDFKTKGFANHKTGHKDKDGRDEVVKLVKYDIRFMKNELKRAKGEDFYYRVNDKFNKPYNVKRSKILEMDNSLFFLKKYKKGIEKEIQKLKSIKDKTKNQEKAIEILEKRLLHTVDFNLKMIKFEDYEEEQLPEDFRKRAENAFDISMDKKAKEGDYPITLTISGESIEF